MVKNPLAMQETQVQSLGWEDALEKEMATHSSILAWRIPRTKEPAAAAAKSLQWCPTLWDPIDGSPLQYSCLKNPMDRGTWRATVHWVTKSRPRLGN